MWNVSLLVSSQVCLLEGMPTASDLGLVDDMWHSQHFVGFDLGGLDKSLSHVDGRIYKHKVLRQKDCFLEDDDYLASVVQ